MAKKNANLSDIKKRNVNWRRFWILFLIWVMVVGILSGITAGSAEDDTARIIIFVILGVASIVYWAVFYIIFRREKQKGNK